MASGKKKLNPMDDLTPYGNLPPEDNVTKGGPPQRSTPRRGGKQGMVDDYRWMTGGRDPEPTKYERAESRKKSTLSKKDQELDAQAAAIDREYIEMQLGQREFDRLTAEEYSDEKPKKMRGGGSVGSASKRADGCATKGKTRGRMV